VCSAVDIALQSYRIIVYLRPEGYEVSALESQDRKPIVTGRNPFDL